MLGGECENDRGKGELASPPETSATCAPYGFMGSPADALARRPQRQDEAMTGWEYQIPALPERGGSSQEMVGWRCIAVHLDRRAGSRGTTERGHVGRAGELRR